MSTLSTQSPVGAFVTHNQFSTAILNKYRLDFCCGGKQPLDEACVEKGLDVNVVFSELNASTVAPSADNINWEEASILELADNILDTHHVYVKQELPRLSQLVNKVALVYEFKIPYVTQLQRVWTALHDELAAHIVKEEQVLFPKIKQIANAQPGAPIPNFHCGSMQSPIQVMEIEHEHAGEALRQMRELTDNYRIPEGACTTFKLMLTGLEAFETDLHQHVHKENNILFPKALEQENAVLQ